MTNRTTGATLELKIESRARSDTSRLAAAYALPYRATRHYVTESKATALIEKQPRWMRVNSLASHVRPVPDTLAPADARTYTLSPNVPLDSARTQAWDRHLTH